MHNRQKNKVNKFTVKKIIITVTTLLTATTAALAGSGNQAAAITLALPVGARPLGMGEAFTGIANDANALFYNPAGLGQSPLTISWKTHMADSTFTAVAARSSVAFGARNYVWAGSARGVARFNGRVWERGETYLLEEGESVQSIALKYFHTDDGEIIAAAVDEINRANRLENRDMSTVATLNIPFTIAIRDSVTALALDAAERLWVGTNNGLWRYHNNRWQLFTTANGLPSNRITTIGTSIGNDVAVGTDVGLAIWENGEWTVLTDEDGLPDSYITALAYVRTEQLYIGTNQGLARRVGGDLAVFDTSTGLMSMGVTALFADTKNRLWIGGENGVTIHSGGRSWRRYRFPGSLVYSFAEQSNGSIWIGTNKGVVIHKTTGSDDEPEWRTYHSRNALRNDHVRALAACGGDMWLATDAAVHQYANASRQALLFYEPIMPALQLNDMWHGYAAFILPTEDWGTLGFSINFTNMGDHEKLDEYDTYLGMARAFEGVFGVSYGLALREDLSIGLNAKYVYSVLDSDADGTGQTFAIDAGILKRNFLTPNLDIGFMLQNMGPNIYYLTPEEADPIPFTLRLGLAYHPIQTPFHELTLALDAYREIVRTYDDKSPDPFWVALWTGLFQNETYDDDTESWRPTTFREELELVTLSAGLEYTYADFMSLRTGFLLESVWERYELSLGLGVKYANVNFDFAYIHSPANFLGKATGVRDGQWRISFLVNM